MSIQNFVYCNDTDTIEHHFYYCPESKTFWKRIEQWIESNLDLKFNFTVCEILFGIPFQNTQLDLEMINFILLLGKWYINKTKVDEKVLYFINFIELINAKIQVITSNNKINSRLNKEWHNTLQEIL